MDWNGVTTQFFDNDVDFENRRVILRTDLDEDGNPRNISQLVTNNFIKAVYTLNELDRKAPIHLILNTQGGDVTQGFAIYDAIQGSSAPFYIEGFGEVRSAGTIILQGGEKRMVHPNTKLMVHNPLISLDECALHDARNIMQESEMEALAMYRIYARKSKKPISYWKAMCERELWFSAKEAKKTGLVDSIIRKNYSVPKR